MQSHRYAQMGRSRRVVPKENGRFPVRVLQQKDSKTKGKIRKSLDLRVALRQEDRSSAVATQWCCACDFAAFKRI
jgi:hypothetical protein